MIIFLSFTLIIKHRILLVAQFPSFYKSDSKTDFKRSPFTMQKESFWSTKGVLLERKRSPFRMQKDSFRNAAIEKRRFCTCFYYSATHFRLPYKSHFGKRLALLFGMIIELSQMGKRLRREHAMLKEMLASHAAVLRFTSSL